MLPTLARYIIVIALEDNDFDAWIPVFDKLKECGFDYNRPIDCVYPLFFATTPYSFAESNKLKFLKYLIHQNVDLNEKMVKVPAIFDVLKRKDFLDLFLAQSVNLNVVGLCGESLLKHAIDSGLDFPTIARMIKQGARIEDYTWNSSCAPLEYAVRIDNLPFARFLIENSIELNVTPKKGLLCHVLSSHSVKVFIPLLIWFGVDIDEMIDGETSLIRAVRQKNKTLAKLLLENGADPTKPDVLGNQPLKIAKQTKRPKLIAFFTKTKIP